MKTLLVLAFGLFTLQVLAQDTPSTCPQFNIITLRSMNVNNHTYNQYLVEGLGPSGNSWELWTQDITHNPNGDVIRTSPQANGYHVPACPADPETYLFTLAYGLASNRFAQSLGWLSVLPVQTDYCVVWPYTCDTQDTVLTKYMADSIYSLFGGNH